MNTSINIAEILIVNSTGIICLLFLLMSKYSSKSSKRVGEYLFNSLIIFTIFVLILEIISFLIDGLPGKAIHILQYLSNAFLVFAVTLMGYVWCLFVEFKVYHSLKRVRRIAYVIALPVIVELLLVVLDCFGAGLLFSISGDNVYTRGRFGLITYAFVGFYYLYSIIVVYWARHKGSQIHFFPVYTFVLPCIMGTIVQGMQYGIATGWFSVAIALMLVEMQLQREESFIDELSGLYNRKYLEFFYKQMKIKNYARVYGVMMDLNLFKQINDTYGHTVGDDAIRTFSRLLSNQVETPDTVIRFAGDEFIIICVNKTEDEVAALMDSIKKNLADYNASEKKPYKLSFSMGYTKYSDEYKNLDEFLRDMDQKMYEDKEEFRRRINKAK
ncbi:MAG: GGDEF domain-containing protein [Lachnospiraceae bacterium]